MNNRLYQFRGTYNTGIRDGSEHQDKNGEYNLQVPNLVWNPKKLECNPDSLHERTETTSEECNIFRFLVLFDGVQSGPCTLVVVVLSSVVRWRH